MEQDVQDQDEWTRIEMNEEMTTVKSEVAEIKELLKHIAAGMAKLQATQSMPATDPVPVPTPPVIKVSSTGTTIAGAAR